MKSTNRLLQLGAVAVLTFGLSACDLSSLADQAVEAGLEKAIEADTGEDFNLDFDSGNGGFSITTDEGEFNLDITEDGFSLDGAGDDGDFSITGDEGGLVFDGPDGEEATVDFTDDGFVFESDEANGEVVFNEDGITFDTDQGSGEIGLEEDGITFETDQGHSGKIGLTNTPEDWPELLGVPSSFDENQSFFTTISEADQGFHTAVIVHAAREDFAGAVSARLTNAGFESQGTVTSPEGVGTTFVRGEEQATVFTDNEGTTTIYAALAS